MGLISSALKVVDKVTGGFLGSISGSSQQKDANRMALKSWNMANDYNHPVKQMERLREAGLNPNLVYDSGSVTGNTTGAPSLVGGGVQTPVESAFSGINNIMGVLQGQANLNNTRAQTQASTAAAGASGAQAANLNAQAAFQETRNKFAEQSMIADLDYKKAQTRLANEQAKKTAAEGDIAQGEADIFGSVGGSKGAGMIGKAAGNFARMLRGVMH